jgi:chaperonin GroES
VGTTIHIVKAVEEVMISRKVHKVICEKIMIFLLAKEIEIIYY